MQRRRRRASLAPGHTSLRVTHWARGGRDGEGLCGRAETDDHKECLSRKPSRSSDIWATGMVLYELFTQNCEPWSHTEFEPKSSNAVQEFLDHVKVNADRPRFSNDWVEQNTCHREVHMAILHCWELQPDKRPSASHALELFDVLLQKELIPN